MRNQVINSDFIIPISLLPNVVDFRYFNLGIHLDILTAIYRSQMMETIRPASKQDFRYTLSQ